MRAIRQVALGMAVLWLVGGVLRADDAEKMAVKAIEKLGGRVTYRQLVVGEFAGDVVVEVSLCETPVTDADLKELAPFKHLEKLWLIRTGVTDEGLKELAGLKNLQTLSLCNTWVSDEGLKELAALEQLRVLYLRGTTVKGPGVDELRKRLPKLKIFL